MDVASRSLIRDPECAVTGSQDAYPADYGTGTGHLIDFTFTNSAKSTGKNGAAPGGQADEAELAKYVQYHGQFHGLNANSSPALIILCMERHGSWSQGTRDYWKALVHAAHERLKTREFPVHLSVLTRRVLQTLAVALRRMNASRILQFRRRALDGAQRVGQGVEGPAGA